MSSIVERALRPEGVLAPLEPPESPSRSPARWRTAVTSPAAGIAWAGTCLSVVAAAFAAGVTRFPAMVDDEGTYVAQAWAVLTRGTLGHYTYWYDHPPLGWIQLALMTVVERPVSWLFGSTGSAVLDARQLMLLPAMITCALLYVLARRLGIGRFLSGLAVLAFGLSPLAITLLRQVYLDGLALPWVLASFVLVMSPRRRLWAFAAGGACLAVGVLSKETMLVVLPAVGLALWDRCDRRTRSFCVAAFAVPFVLLLLAYPLLALLKGELLAGPGHVSLLEAIHFQISGRPSTGSGLIAGTDSRAVIDGWLALDPWLLGVGVLAGAAALWSRRLRPIGLALLLLVAVGLSPGYLPQPYVIAVLPFCALAASGVIDVGVKRALIAARGQADGGERPSAVAVVATVVCLTSLTIGALLIGTHWATLRRGHDAWDANAATLEATRWLDAHVDHSARILVDDTYFVDLVDAGFDPDLGVVWFYKLDLSANLDPSVIRSLPLGHREFDYVVSSPTIRAALDQYPEGLQIVRQAISASRVVATFGTGTNAVEIRRLMPDVGSDRGRGRRGG